MHTKDYNAIKIEPYPGGNSRVDDMLTNFPDDVVWVVQGAGGRRLIPAPTAEAAKARYVEIYEERMARFES